MAQPMPASLAAFNEIIKELNSLVTSQPSELVLRRKLKELEDRAEALKDLSLAYGFSALGSIAAAKGDIAAMHKNHKISLQYDSSIALLNNYAVSLWKCGLTREAFDYASSLFDSHPDDVALIHQLTYLAFELGDEPSYLRFASLYRDLTKQEHETWPAYQEARNEIQGLSRQCAAATARACARADG